ncbi:hypothetical protein GCM10027347_41960 [Larkinella harenae]
MKQFVKISVIPVLVFGVGLSSCVVSKFKPLSQVSGVEADSSSVTVFLLERDIPQDIEKLGVVTIANIERATVNTDKHVKRQLQKDCQRLGANGAFRVNDGTYHPAIVNYLVFKYKKE